MWYFDDTDTLREYRSDHSIVMLKLKFEKKEYKTQHFLEIQLFAAER